MIVLPLLAMVALVAVNALFVATEFALVAARPSSLKAAAADGSGSATRCGCATMTMMTLHGTVGS